jgi:hypothetical protein
MKSFFYIAKPISQNNRGRKKIASYRRGLKTKLNSIYGPVGHLFPTSSIIYGVVYYFRKNEVGFDADNISKPLWDALETVCYDNDKRIRLRLAAVVTLDYYNNYRIPVTSLSIAEANQINSFFKRPQQQHMIYVHLDNADPKSFKFRL